MKQNREEDTEPELEEPDLEEQSENIIKNTVKENTTTMSCQMGVKKIGGLCKL